MTRNRSRSRKVVVGQLMRPTAYVPKVTPLASAMAQVIGWFPPVRDCGFTHAMVFAILGDMYLLRHMPRTFSLLAHGGRR